MLSIFGTRPLGPIFNQLTLPALRTLSLGEEERQSGLLWPHTDFISLLSRSSCPIQTLTLHNVEPSQEQLIECLRHISNSLLNLHIAADDNKPRLMIVKNDLLRLLTSRIEEQGMPGPSRRNAELPLCPKLETISFRGCVYSTDGMFSDMVTSRMHVYIDGQQEGVARLRSVVVGLLKDQNEEDIRKLNTLQAEDVALCVFRE
jgi:hypothetical protein